MARIRTIKPEFWTHDEVTECSITARLLYIGLWNFADDEGRLQDSPKTIKGQIFPFDDISRDGVHALLTELSVNNRIIRYTVGNKDFIQIMGWEHQKINRKTPSKIPPPPDDIHGALTEDSPPEGKGREGKGVDDSSLRSESSEPDGSMTDEDWLKLEGEPYLATHGETTESAAGLIRQWLKEHSPTDIKTAIQTAQVSATGRPTPYVSKILMNQLADARRGIKPGQQNTARARDGGGLHPDAETNQWAGRLKQYRDRNFWVVSWGPKPGERDCQAPAEIVAEVIGDDAAVMKLLERDAA